jgi:signal transduction histidine kinase
MRVPRLGIRHRLLLVVLAGVTVALAGLVVGFNLILDRTLDHNSRNLARTRAAAQAALLRSDHGRLVVVETPDDAAADSYIWVFSGGRTVERPHAGPRIEAAALALAHGPARFADVPSEDVRLFAEPVVVDRVRLGTVVAGVSLAAYEQTQRIALTASAVLGVLVLVLVAVAAGWLLRSALRPVHTMTTQAASWSELELDDRFPVGEPYDELTELADTLNGLLDRIASSFRREQRFSAEISHELRTPLARVLAESELALRRERTPEEYRHALELVHRNAAQLTRMVDALVAAARHQTGRRGTADAYDVAAGAAGACAGLISARGLELDLRPPANPVRVGVELDLAERILQPVLENACRYGSSTIRVSIDRDRRSVYYAIEDDGPGVDATEQEQIFEPGVRGRLGSANGTAGAGLGLALARRLARGVDGNVEASADTGHGRFVVTLPAS